MNLDVFQYVLNHLGKVRFLELWALCMASESFSAVRSGNLDPKVVETLVEELTEWGFPPRYLASDKEVYDVACLITRRYHRDYDRA